MRKKFKDNVDDLIKPIISLEIINAFAQFATPFNSENEFQISKNAVYNTDIFPVLPIKFDGYK
jgi:hypothetical protein